MEATSENGVMCFSLTDYFELGWFDQFKRLSFRKLNVSRNKQFEEVMKNFSNEVLGKKYQINIKRLLRHDSIDETRSGYFCSELVASLYKRLGLLDRETSAASYWPTDFSENGGLRLNNATFGFEMCLQYEKSIQDNIS